MQHYHKALVGTLCDLLLHQKSPQVMEGRDLPSIMHWALLLLMETVTSDSDKPKLHRLRKHSKCRKVLIVDEVSMVGCRIVGDLHSRLLKCCNAKMNHSAIYMWY